jgi:hypothetical protein
MSKNTIYRGYWVKAYSDGSYRIYDEDDQQVCDAASIKHARQRIDRHIERNASAKEGVPTVVPIVEKR